MRCLIIEGVSLNGYFTFNFDENYFKCSLQVQAFIGPATVLSMFMFIFVILSLSYFFLTYLPENQI
jgi:hypothetical protein